MKKVLILLAALGLAFGVTIPKLYRMCQIKGWIPGAASTAETITQKWNQTPDQHPRGRNTFWLAWSETDIRTIGDHRVNVPEVDWKTLEIGDPIEVVLDDDGRPYLRDGIFVSPGNFVFDGILLFLELSVAIAMGLRLLKQQQT